nr:ribonuclease H-like domain-containing protein [Tanacetum cinerariifolium]
MYGEEPTPQMSPLESPQMMSTIKLLILKKVIINGDEPVQTTKDENGVETEVPLKTAQAILTRQRERKAKIILLLAILDEYQPRFDTIKDTKSLWASIKSRFGGNVESKKMQKTVLKEQLKNFSVSDTKGLDKSYDRFQKFISLLEVHGVAVSIEDANLKFLRALPSSWNNIALIMMNKEGIDKLDINDLLNNLKVFEADIKGHSSSRQASSSSYTDDMMFSFFATYQLGLESVEAQLIVHQKNEVVYVEKIAVLEFKVKDKGNAITRLTNQLDKTLKQREDLKAKLEQFEISSKNLNKLINSQLSTKDKTCLRYGDQLSESDSEVLPSVFDSRSSDGDDNQINDRFKKDDGYHAVPPPLTGNYMPPLVDLSFAGLDDSIIG